ncbi:PspC domain-containing protein [Streptococcus ovis]|uniref:PspC domain-containing protein n=1 Tax=Streptococcus ovis TaxID=82806 RepID=UPI000360ED59|nr:PspC domain-containing protein [Streptococcus ovis]
MYGFYRTKRNRLLTGVLAGVADRFDWDTRIVRGIFLAIVILTKVGLLAIALYVLAAVFLPYKEDVDAERYGTGPRKRKEAEKVEKEWFF